MTATINASTSAGVVTTADTSGILQLQTNGTAALTVDASQNVGIGTASPAYKLDVVTSSNPNFIRTGVTGTNAGAGVIFQGAVNTRNNWVIANQYNVSGALEFTQTTAAGGSTIGATPSMLIDRDGNLLVGTTNTSVYNQNSVNGIGIIPGTSSGIQIATDPAGSTGNASIILNMRNTPINGAKYIRFFYNGGNDIGNISLNGTTAVAYNTSSDYRLKNTIAPMTGALDKVAVLKPVTYKWNADNSDGQGFIAHELAEVVPDCVSGEKDAVETYTDEDGNEATRPVYQGIDTSFLVATLTAAIQELKAIVDAQGAEIAKLKGATA